MLPRSMLPASDPEPEQLWDAQCLPCFLADLICPVQDAKEGADAALSNASSTDKQVMQMETQLEQHRYAFVYILIPSVLLATLFSVVCLAGKRHSLECHINRHSHAVCHAVLHLSGHCQAGSEADCVYVHKTS